MVFELPCHKCLENADALIVCYNGAAAYIPAAAGRRWYCYTCLERKAKCLCKSSLCKIKFKDLRENQPDRSR